MVWKTGKIVIELDKAGVRELLLSDGVGDEIERRGEEVAAAARQRYAALPVGSRDKDSGGATRVPVVVHRGKGRNRSRVNVVGDHPAAQPIEAAHRVLGQAIDAARD